MDNIPLYIAIVASVAIALLVAVLVKTVIVPWMRKKIERETRGGKAKFTFGDSDGEAMIFLQEGSRANCIYFLLSQIPQTMAALVDKSVPYQLCVMANSCQQ